MLPTGTSARARATPDDPPKSTLEQQDMFKIELLCSTSLVEVKGTEAFCDNRAAYIIHSMQQRDLGN